MLFSRVKYWDFSFVNQNLSLTESYSMIFPVTIAPSHSRTYLSFSFAFSAISLAEEGGSVESISNNLVLCPTDNMIDKEPLFITSIMKLEKSLSILHNHVQ